MKHQELLNASEDWLKYAIRLNLWHEPKEDLTELRHAAVSNIRIQSFLHDVARGTFGQQALRVDGLVVHR